MQPFYVEAGALSPVWAAAVRDFCPGIHCFLRQEVCGDLFILCKGRCVVECPENHLFVEAPAVMGASYIWCHSHFRDAIVQRVLTAVFRSLCRAFSRLHMQTDVEAPVSQLCAPTRNCNSSACGVCSHFGQLYSSEQIKKRVLRHPAR
jgi:hypothetical protein